MQTLIYVPPGGDYNDPAGRIKMTTDDPYILSTIEGISGTDATVISSTIAGIDGVRVHGLRTEPREIKCTVYVKGDTREDMYRKRFNLIKSLTYNGDLGTAYYKNDFIKLMLPVLPRLPPDFTERIKNYNKCDIVLYAPFPHWESLSEKTEHMAYLPDVGFSFPFEFYDTISFADIANEIKINYMGSIPAPVEITVIGPAEKPRITHAASDKFIGLYDKDLSVDERLIINTDPSNLSVTLQSGGVTKDAFEYIDPESDFFLLTPGINHFKYSSEDDGIQTQIYIKHKEFYSGV